MKNISLIRVAIWQVVVISMLGIAACCPPFCRPESTTTEFEEIDYVPNGTSNYDVQCTGNRPIYDDVKLYTPQLMLTNPLDVTRTLVFTVKEDRAVLSDPQLGVFRVTILAGHRSPSTMATVADGGAGPDYVPAGAPDPETQGFWLACTAKCKVRGNSGRGDDGHANVYIEMLEVQPASGSSVRILGNYQSPRHTIRCNSVSTGTAPSHKKCNYNVQKCCGSKQDDGTCLGQCWPQRKPCP